MKIHYFLMLTLLTFVATSCKTSRFTSSAKFNEFDASQDYLMFKNDHVGIESFTYGHFRFPATNREVRKARKGRIPFKNILLYAHTTNPQYEYYILLNNYQNIKTSDNFLRKDTLINNQKISVVASKDIPKSDWKFIWKNIQFTTP